MTGKLREWLMERPEPEPEPTTHEERAKQLGAKAGQTIGAFGQTADYSAATYHAVMALLEEVQALRADRENR